MSLPACRSASTKWAAEAGGFERALTQNFTVTTNARQRVDVTMKLGSVSDTVTVTAAPTQLETETSSRGQVIANREVENLPPNGRSYADLVLLAPGVRKSALENQTASSREASFNVNGQRSAFNNFMLDGLDNNNYGTSNQRFANENIPAVARCCQRVQGRDGQLFGRVWPGFGGCHQCVHAARQQSVSR